VVGKSPLTGGWGDANCGGYLGPYLKFSGYDAVFFNGVSPTPVYLLINDGKAELRDASHLWGKDTWQTEELLKSQMDEKVAVACIGPASEKLSLISCVMHDVGCAAGRSGLGAVMGSKKLKAVAVMGTKEVPVPNRQKAAEVYKEYLGQLSGDYYEKFKKWGTCGVNAESAANGDSPVKNWGGVGIIDFPNAEAISDDAVTALQKRKHACLWCPIACKGIMKAGKQYKYEAGVHKPEYETCASFGMLLLNDNMESIVKVNDICNRYGLDTISAGATIAFATECYENRIITKEDTEGIELGWGNHAAIVALLEKLARREGFGDLLADGVKRAAERIGKGSEKYAHHAGGQELAMHDPRFMPMMGYGYECDPTPGRHTSGGGIVGYAKFMRVINASGMCLMQWVSAPGMDVAKFISTATGWDFGLEEMFNAGERISNIRQAFNVREGIKPKDFKITPRLAVGEPPLEQGPLAGVTVDVDATQVELFKEMDWDLETGRPSKEKLKSLGLDDVAKDLWP